MRRVALFAASIASVFGTAAPAAPAKVDMSPATQRDVRCFMLFAAAVNDAQKANNDKMREATGLGVMFYFGKLATEAPSLNIVDAVLQEGSWMEGNPAVKDVGATCDAEFKNSSQRLIDIGQKLKAAGSQSSH